MKSFFDGIDMMPSGNLVRAAVVCVLYLTAASVNELYAMKHQHAKNVEGVYVIANAVGRRVDKHKKIKSDEELQPDTTISSTSGPHNFDLYQLFDQYMSRIEQSGISTGPDTPLFLKPDPDNDTLFTNEIFELWQIRAIPHFVCSQLGIEPGTERFLLLHSTSVLSGHDLQI